MADRVFIGLCVGGPLAGDTIAQYARFFNVHEHPKRHRRVRPDDPIPDEAVKATQYIHHHHTGGPLNLWLYDSMDITEALRLMAEAYVSKAQVQRAEDTDMSPGEDVEFVHAWEAMRANGHHCSMHELDKVHLGWRMHRMMVKREAQSD